MRSPSFSLGRIFGVELRLHLYAIASLVLLLLYASIDEVSLGRGFLLWLLLFAAVAVRETARALAAAWAGLDLRRLVLLPIGALPTYAEGVPQQHRHERLVALSGPVANFVAALTMALLTFSATSQVNLFQSHLMEPQHLLRAAIWMQIVLGGLHLLPATPLDAGVLMRRQFVRVRGAAKGAKASAGLGQAIGWLLVLVGSVSQEVVVILMGGTVLLTAQTESHALLAKDAAKGLTMRDVMLTEWTSLDASDTLEDAVRRSTHSLQEVFPVIRGQVVVGSVARASLLFALRTEGNGYVQSVMTRGVQSAQPDAPLVGTVQTAATARLGVTTVMPIVEGERVIGMVTPQNLLHSMALLGRTHRLLEQDKAPKRRGRDD